MRECIPRSCLSRGGLPVGPEEGRASALLNRDVLEVGEEGIARNKARQSSGLLMLKKVTFLTKRGPHFGAMPKPNSV